MKKETADEIIARALRGEPYVPTGADEGTPVPAQPAVQGVVYAELPKLFREALAWGMTYGPEIPTHQWEEMRESMVKQYTERASNGQSPATRITVEQVEDAIGLQSTAWDTIGTEKIVEAVLRLANGQAPAGATNTKTHALLSTMIGLFLRAKEKIGYQPGSAIDKTVAEAVEHLKDWPYPETATAQAAPALAENGHLTQAGHDLLMEATLSGATLVSKGRLVGDMAQAESQPAPVTQQAVGNSGFDHKTAADFLSGKTVSDEALRKFVATSRGAHDDRAALRAQMISLRGELASREAEIALLKRSLLDAEAAAPQPAPAAQADSQPAPQGETNAHLDTDSNSSAPGQQRDVAGTVALGQSVGHGSDSTAGDPSAQGDKLLTVAERNIRSFLRSATFKSESDREAALNCVDVLWAAARAPADSVLEDALSDAVRVPLDSLHADAAYLIGRLREGSMPYARVIEIIRERIDAAKAAIRARAAQRDALDAARWHWLSEHIQVAWDEGKFTSLVRIVSEQHRQSLNASVDRMMAGDWSDADAARKQGGA